MRAYTYLYPLAQHDMTAFWTAPDMAAEAAADCVARGYTAVKFDPAGPYTMRGGHMPAMSDISQSVAFCAAIREAVGDRADLLFGTHGQFTTAGAIRLGQALEPYSPLWFEEPVPPDAVEEMAEVARAVRIPVATGERLTTKAEFAAVLRAGAASILQPALGRAGGIWEVKKIAALAEVHKAQDRAASLRRAGGMGGEHPPCDLHPQPADGRDDRDAVPRRADQGRHPGRRTASSRWREAPGLGIEVDEDLARAHPYTGRRAAPADAGSALRLRERQRVRGRRAGPDGLTAEVVGPRAADMRDLSAVRCTRSISAAPAKSSGRMGGKRAFAARAMQS